LNGDLSARLGEGAAVVSEDWHSTHRKFEELGPRHREVLALVARRMTSKEIARQLGVSQHTVEQRIQKVRAGFGNISRRALVDLYLDWSGDNGKRHGESATARPAPMPLPGRAPTKLGLSIFSDPAGRVPVFTAGFSVGITFAMVANLALIASLR